MSLLRHTLTLEEIARDLDLLVFRMEQPDKDESEPQTRERKRTRRELEQIRDRLQDLLRALER